MEGERESRKGEVTVSSEFRDRKLDGETWRALASGDTEGGVTRDRSAMSFFFGGRKVYRHHHVNEGNKKENGEARRG